MTRMPTPPQVQEKHPLLGSLFLLKDNPLQILGERIEKYGDIFAMQTPGRRAVIISNPDYVQYVLMENSRNYRKGMAYDQLRFLLGNGLLTSEGEEWKHNRKLIQPAFHKKRLENFLSMMEQESIELLNDLNGKTEYRDLSQPITKLALEVISKAMFSTGVEAQARFVGEQITTFNEEFVKRISNPLKFPLWVPTPANRKRQKGLDLLNRVVLEIIANKRASKEVSDDLLTMLIETRDEESGSGLSEQQLRDEVMTIFIAGNETSANALLWMIWLLHSNPKEEALLRKELQEVCPGEEPMTLEQLGKLQRLRMIIDESLRLYPPAWMVGRRPYTDDQIGKYTVTKDTNVLVPIYHMHRHPKYWDKPDEFIPERFAPGTKAPNRFQYLPFGAGPRLCIGNHFAIMEMSVVLASIYRNHRIELQPGYVAEPHALVTLRPKNGLPGRLVKA